MQQFIELSNHDILGNILVYLDEYSVQSFLCCIYNTLNEIFAEYSISIYKYYRDLHIAKANKCYKSRTIRLLQTIVKFCNLSAIRKWVGEKALDNIDSLMYTSDNFVKYVRVDNYEGYGNTYITIRLQKNANKHNVSSRLLPEFANAIDMSKFPVSICDYEHPSYELKPLENSFMQFSVILRKVKYSQVLGSTEHSNYLSRMRKENSILREIGTNPDYEDCYKIDEIDSVMSNDSKVPLRRESFNEGIIVEFSAKKSM